MNVVMPQLGETVKEGTVTVWHKKVGEQVKEGERLFEVTTEKVDTEIPAPVSGVLSALLVPEGQTVQVGTTLAIIDEPGKAVRVQPSAQRTAPESSATGSQPIARDDLARGERLSPVVRKLIAEHNLNPAEIRGSGAGGRITRDDVLAYLERSKPPAVASQPARERESLRSAGERVALSRIRKRTAEQMALSWRTIPHVFQAMEVDFEAVEQARSARGEAWNAKQGWPLTYLPFVAHALCAALAEFPVLNSSFEGDSLLMHSSVNLGIAVDLGPDGLIVPVVKQADRKSLPELARAIRSFA
ncbi:MAG TPA: dihydrolipoamide acetyltransferase family protein, partial [Myxococcaceae bacterium]|nr:dihydrolipoamide acetyltransferase family protein [Myxococcaceae bacterium]